MIETLARSIAETAADNLGRRANDEHVSDDMIGLHLAHERGFRNHDDLVATINFTREIFDRRERDVQEARQKLSAPSRRPLSPSPDPMQFSLDLEIA